MIGTHLGYIVPMPSSFERFELTIQRWLGPLLPRWSEPEMGREEFIFLIAGHIALVGFLVVNELM